MRRAEKVQKKQLKADVEESSGTPDPLAPPQTVNSRLTASVGPLETPPVSK